MCVAGATRAYVNFSDSLASVVDAPEHISDLPRLMAIHVEARKKNFYTCLEELLIAERVLHRTLDEFTTVEEVVARISNHTK